MDLSGLEPPTSRLSGVRSNQLSYKSMERVMGIEPTTSAWKAEVLPLNYTRIDIHFPNSVETPHCHASSSSSIIQRCGMRRGNSQLIHRSICSWLRFYNSQDFIFHSIPIRNSLVLQFMYRKERATDGNRTHECQSHNLVR